MRTIESSNARVAVLRLSSGHFSIVTKSETKETRPRYEFCKNETHISTLSRWGTGADISEHAQRKMRAQGASLERMSQERREREEAIRKDRAEVAELDSRLKVLRESRLEPLEEHLLERRKLYSGVKQEFDTAHVALVEVSDSQLKTTRALIYKNTVVTRNANTAHLRAVRGYDATSNRKPRGNAKSLDVLPMTPVDDNDPSLIRMTPSRA